MLDIYEVTPDGNWTVTKNDDKFDTLRVKVDSAAEVVNPLIDESGASVNSRGYLDSESYIRDFYHDPTSGSFTATVPKGMIELKEDVLIGYSQKKQKNVYGDMIVLTNQGIADEDEFYDLSRNMARYVGQNTDVEHSLTIYDDEAQFWNNGDKFGVNVQPMTDIMDANGRKGDAPKQFIHTHPINSYVGVDSEFYNLGSSQPDRDLVRDIASGYKSNGYESTINSVYNPVFSNDFIEYNAQGDIGVENSDANKDIMNQNIQNYKRARYGR